ncbi:FecCD family ABC transporter permease [Rhodovulum visakhapatnamense]|uniref:Iron complex transport system permease protein n=1 Tax=Rhodovulum visakhapatnamense TaxID=364297 RepID=A0A4R8G141_9RHOB|nr:iron ABC transporter permease [Rhodovulum visakhapatnamense]TDX33283.1 iron complex transport system permease protein [Rhodovulum visakhapatnamense]
MSLRVPVLAVAALGLGLSLIANLSAGPGGIGPGAVWEALIRFEPESYDHAVVAFQRLPRAVIAIYMGAVMAVSGTVLQALMRNPLASPATLGINSGAALAVLAGAYLLDLGIETQGVAALAGGTAGFLAVLWVARLAGLSRDPRGLSLILAGALVSMFLTGMANAFLLADPVRRTDFLGWVTGNINHVYAERLYDFWWIGAASFGLLMALARPLTLIALGREKAASAGVNVPRVRGLALAAVVLGASSAVAVCGPVAFIGLVVPHMVRPFAGAGLARALPAAALTGAALCLWADLVARTAFAPHVVHTGLILDVVGGLVFAVIVRRVYLAPAGAAR